MARNQKIEAILTAWFETQDCIPSERANARKKLNTLLDEIVGLSQGQVTREVVLDTLFSQFQEFKKELRKNEKVKGAQASVS